MDDIIDEKVLNPQTHLGSRNRDMTVQALCCIYIYIYKFGLVLYLTFLLQRIVKSESYYDLFLKKYQELAKQRKWKQPLLGKCPLLLIV